MTYLFDTDIDVDFKFDYLKLYECVAERCLDIEKCPYEAEVSLFITDDDRIRDLNRENRDIDKATDVLSFPMNNFDLAGDFGEKIENEGTFSPESGELILGDIVLSLPHIKAQAEEYGHSIEREYAFLIVHSMLHLCGYDHIEETDRVIMEDRQKVIMESLYDEFPALKVNNG